MSHSYRKPYSSYVCYYSNKKDKRIANRKFRKANKRLLKRNPDNLHNRLREVSEVYNFSSDGLAYYVGNSRLANSKEFDDKETFRKLIQK